MVDAELSQIAYLLDLIEIVEIYVTHDRADLTGNNDDTTQKKKVTYEGNPSHPLDFHNQVFSNNRIIDATYIAKHLKATGRDTTWWENVIAGKQVYADKRFSTTGAAVATTGFPTASTINVAEGQLFYFVNPTGDMVVNARNSSTIGTHAYIFLSNATIGSSINFGTGFRATALLSSGAIMNNISSLGSGKVNTIHFMGDGFGMTEVSRTLNFSSIFGGPHR
jgi:hypothetical protein